VLFDKSTYDKLYKEVPSYKLITPSVVSERLKVRGSLAKVALAELHAKGSANILDREKISFHFSPETGERGSLFFGSPVVSLCNHVMSVSRAHFVTAGAIDPELGHIL
jgi:hypothetical protein